MHNHSGPVRMKTYAGQVLTEDKRLFLEGRLCFLVGG